MNPTQHTPFDEDLLDCRRNVLRLHGVTVPELPALIVAPLARERAKPPSAVRGETLSGLAGMRYRLGEQNRAVGGLALAS